MRKLISLLVATLLIVALAAPAGAGGYVDKYGRKSALWTVDYAHYEIHAGAHYFWTNASTISTGQGIAVLFHTTDAPAVHLHYDVEATGSGSFALYEGVTNSSAGGFVTPVNRNRASANSSGHLLKIGNHPSAYGTLLHGDLFGSGKQVGGSVRGDNEIVLAANTAYYLVANSTSNQNGVSLMLDWYEHDPVDEEH